MNPALLMSLLWIGAVHASAGQSSITTPSSTEQELISIAQSLLEAVGEGDKSVWDRYLDEECLYTAEDGHTLTKEELLTELRPLPEGYDGSLTVANPQVRDYGDTAVITYDALERLNIYGQQIDTRFHTTDTYIQRDGQWRMIASQVTVIPGDPVPAAIDPAVYGVYVGRYSLAPGVIYNVTRTGGKLFIQRGEGEKEELFPVDEVRFFREGRRGEVIFVTDSTGIAGRLILRRDHNDIVWTRVAE